MSHYSDIGLNFKNKQEFVNFLKDNWGNAEAYFSFDEKNIPCLKEIKMENAYIYSTFCLDLKTKESEFKCSNPAFKGKIFKKVKIDKIYNNECDFCFYFEGSLKINGGEIQYLGETKTEPTPSSYVCFLSPDYLIFKKGIKKGDIVDVNLVGFANIFDISKKEETKMQGSFIPVKTLKELNEGETEEIDDNTYVIMGEIINIDEIINPKTNLKFLKIILDQEMIGEIEIVLDPSVVKGELKKGNIAFCNCWLTGNIKTDFSDNNIKEKIPQEEEGKGGGEKERR